MQAIRIHAHGGPDVLVAEELPDPEPADGEVLVRLHAASLNHLDVWIRKGMPRVPLPRTLGGDGAGVVEALGAGVDGIELGQRVFLNPSLQLPGGRMIVLGEQRDGTHCELIAVPAVQALPLDDHLSFEEAAAFPLVFVTAYRMLVTRARVQEGDWVLIWGIGGGVSTAAFEIARALGLRTIVTSGSTEKLERARAWGADLALHHHEEDVVAAVREATGGGADVVVESIGDATWKRTLEAVRREGQIVVCGATTGTSPPAGLHRWWWKQLTLHGSSMGSRAELLGAYELIRTGRARVHVDSVYPLSRLAAAHERLEAGDQLGKIVIDIA